VGTKEYTYTVGENINLYNCYRKQYRGSSKKLKTELPVISLLGIHPKECAAGYNTATCTPMFTKAKLWKQPRCPTTEEEIKKLQWSIIQP
jgi:hypothetical protein